MASTVRAGSRSTIDGAGLSPREIDVLELMAEGLSNESVAERLYLSVKSVESTIRSIMMKLDLFEDPHANRRVLAVRMFLDSAPASMSGWPSWASHFVGRTAELEELARLVDEHRLVTVVGPGGIGKTRLVAELAGRIAEDGTSTHFVDLTGATGIDVLGRLCSSFGIVLTNENASWRRLERVLQARPRLTVLDNAETCVTEVRQLVPRLISMTDARVLVTSREPLAFAGERLYPIPPLVVSEGRQLLVTRVADCGVDVSGGSDRAAVDSVLEKLSGMPLAIELVAVRFASLSLDAVGEQLGHLPELLERPGTDRHASIRSALDASYGSLGFDVQRAFRLLSVFVGGLTLQSAEHILGTSTFEVGRVLDRLVRSSLFGFARGRYRMLEPVRQYAADLCQSHDELAESDTALVEWCAQLVSGAGQGYARSARHWRERLDPEAANIEAAINAALDLGHGESALILCSELTYYWASERPGATLPIAERVVARLDGTESEVLRAWGVLCLGRLRCETWDYAGGTALLDVAAELFEKHDDRVGLMLALLWLSGISRPDLYDRVIALANENSFPEIEGWAYLAKVNEEVFRQQPQPRWNEASFHSEIDPWLDQAQTIALENGFDILRFEVLLSKVRIRLLGGCFDASLGSDSQLDSMMTEAEQLARSVGNASMIAEILRARNVWRARLGRWLEARGSIAEQLDLSSWTDQRLLLTSGVLLVASLLDAEGRQDEARSLIATAAPTYCAYAAEPSWLQYNLSSAELFEYAFEHRDGPILDTDQLNDLVVRCKALLGVAS